jgi:hypothetical protein
MSPAPGPPVTECTLRPDRRHVGEHWRHLVAPLRQRLLIWRRPTGWVVAHGDPHRFTVIAADLACWHLARHVAYGARWDPGDGGIHPPRWAAPSLPARHECWGAR